MTDFAAASVAALNAASSSTRADGDTGKISLGVWPDTEVIDLVYLASPNVWVEKRERTLIKMNDQGYMGLPNNGSAGTDNSVAGLVYVAAGSFNAANAGNVNQAGHSLEVMDRADLAFAAGLLLAAKMEGFFAGNGTVAMRTLPHWFQRNSGDVPGAFADAGPRLGVPADAIAAAAIATANRISILSPVAAIAGGVQWLQSGWQLVVELTSVNVTKRELYPRLFAWMPGGAIASPTPAGAMIDVRVATRWYAGG